MKNKEHLIDTLAKKAYTPYEDSTTSEILVAYIPDKDEDELRKIANQYNLRIRFGEAIIWDLRSEVAFFKAVPDKIDN